MVPRFNKSEAVEVEYEANIGKWHTFKRWVCPECVDHVQEKAQENEEIADCKNLFVDDDGEIVGQCQCYSKEHGCE